MLHHRYGRLAKICDDSQPMTPILDIRRRWSVLSPFDPFHIPNPSLGMFSPVQCGFLVWIRPIAQPTILPTNRPVNLGILEHLSPEFQSENLWKILLQSGPIDFANLLLAHRA